MGRLEKQILFAALALVAVLLTFVIVRGVDFEKRPVEAADGPPSEWMDPADTPPLILPEEPIGTPAEGIGSEILAIPDLVIPDQGAGAESLAVVPERGESAATEPRPMASTPAPAQPQASVGPWVYVVKAGDTLSQIAKRELGSIRHQKRIEEMNPGVDENTVLDIGQELRMPDRSAIQKQEQARVLSLEPKALPGSVTHKIRSGDSLWDLAKRYYGSGSDQAMQRIADANPEVLRDGINTVLKLGTVLVIPGVKDRP